MCRLHSLPHELECFQVADFSLKLPTILLYFPKMMGTNNVERHCLNIETALVRLEPITLRKCSKDEVLNSWKARVLSSLCAYEGPFPCDSVILVCMM